MSVLQLKEQLFKLPSAGLANPDSNLINGDTVKLRPWVAGDQRYFGNSNQDPYVSYSTFLNRLVVEPKPLNVDELLLDDVNAILYAVRVLSFGSEYPLPYLNNNSGDWRVGVADLSTIDMNTADDPTRQDSFKADGLELTLSGKKVTFHLKRLKDEKAISNHMTYLRKTNKLVNETVDKQFVNLAQLLDTIDGTDTPFAQKFDFINNLSEEDFVTFINEVNRKGIGIPGTIMVKDKDTGEEQEAALVITSNFFRSTSRGN